MQQQTLPRGGWFYFRPLCFLPMLVGMLLPFMPLMAIGQAGWALNKPASSATFWIKNAGFKVDGRFAVFDGQFIGSKNDIASWQLVATASTNSIDTDNDTRDGHLRGEDYFDVEQHPNISFESQRFYTKGSQLMVEGTFTLKGKSTKMNLPVTQDASNGLTLTTSFEINRRDYKVGGWSLILSDDVHITVKLAFSQP